MIQTPLNRVPFWPRKFGIGSLPFREARVQTCWWILQSTFRKTIIVIPSVNCPPWEVSPRTRAAAFGPLGRHYSSRDDKARDSWLLLFGPHPCGGTAGPWQGQGLCSRTYAPWTRDIGSQRISRLCCLWDTGPRGQVDFVDSTRTPKRPVSFCGCHLPSLKERGCVLFSV